MAISQKTRLALLVLILAFATLVRLYNIDKESFWADEGWTMILVKGPTLSDVVQTMANDQHPPLYFALLHYWIGLTGDSERTIRLLSTFWSLVAIAALYRLGADVYSPEAGLIAALLLALADNDTYLAQEARHYTQMAALAVLSTLFYLRYCRDLARYGPAYSRARRRDGVLWLLTSSALLYTHYLGGFILIIQLLHALITVRPFRRLGDVLFRWGAICLSWLPWAFVFVNQAQVRYTRPILSQSAYPNTPEAFGILRGDLLGSHFGLTIALIVLGLVYVSYRGETMRIALRPVGTPLYMAGWLLIPTIVMIAINPRFPILTPRNLLLITPVIALLVAHGLSNFELRSRLFLLTVIVLVDLFTVDAYFIKPPYRQIAQDMLTYRNGDEPLLLDVWTDTFALRYHIGRDLQTDPDHLPLVLLPVWKEDKGAAYYPDLLTYLSDKDAFWMAYWGKPDDPDFQFFADRGFVRTSTQSEKHLDVNTIYVYRYDRVGTGKLTRFGGLFDLKKAWIDPRPYAPGDSLRVNLLWQAAATLPRDYSVSVFALSADGRAIGQHDGPPMGPPTSTWAPGDVYFDSHAFPLPRDLVPGTYSIGVKIYWYGDQLPLPVNGDSKATSFTLGQITVK
ncbi:MAG TPA: glycosyltransferase family 39 protein [Aggregatilineales bacterium]|nr:glycosyltransferase family 39 protein [Aggregatilineales bacterium]